METQEVSSLIWYEPEPSEMGYWVAAALAFVLLRLIVEKFILKQIGIFVGIKSRAKTTPDKIPCRNPDAIPFLKNFYDSESYKNGSSQSQISELSTRINLEVREIERWLRQRRAIDKTSKLTKFIESGWRFVCYVLSTIIGTWALWDKEWTWDNNALWKDFPNHNVPLELRLYYLYGFGLYLSFLITQAFDVKRKDFWEMFVHHIATVNLLATSWAVNFVRIGSMIMLLHDCSDVFMELAKMGVYVKNEALSASMFVAFMVTWIITRLYIFPKKIIWDNCSATVHYLPPHISYPLIGLLVLLFCLHLFWTYFICKIALAVINPGTENGKKDSRSSTELSSDSELDEKDNNASKILLISIF